jgi:glucokinase
MQNCYAVGIDVGATTTKIGLVQAPDRLLDHQTIPSQLSGNDPTPFLTAAGQVIERFVASYPVAGIGVSLCSLINVEHTGALLSVNAPALNHFDMKASLTDRFGCPVLVGNDVAAYALAEYHFGAGQGVKRLLCLALGTGLAIACILHGRVLETWGGVPADAGRIILQPEAEVTCNGGVRGSAEALCGTAQIERLGRIGYQRKDITAREVILAAQQGADPAAAKIMAEVGRSVGHLLAILSPVFFPQRIVITGGTAEAGEALFQAIRERYAGLIGPYMVSLAGLETGTARPVEIVKGQLGPDAAILGSAVSFFEGKE